jgi:hypothetical protein
MTLAEPVGNLTTLSGGEIVLIGARSGLRKKEKRVESGKIHLFRFTRPFEIKRYY